MRRTLVVAVVLMASSRSHASRPNCPLDVMLSAPIGEAPSSTAWAKLAAGVRLLHGAVDLVCDRGVLACRVTATLQLESASELAIERPVVLRSIAEVFDLDVAASSQVRALAPGARAEVVVTGTLRLERHGTDRSRISSGCAGAVVDPPIHVRHLVLASRGSTITGRLPVPGGAVVTTSGRPASMSVDRRALLVDNREPPHPLRRGGPFVALGARMFGDAKDSLLVRGGYEVSAGAPWLIASLAVETVGSEVVMAPVIEAAISTRFMQAFALGVGVPVHLDRAAVGVRAQVTLHPFPFVGLVQTVDRIDGTTVVALWGQLSL